MGLTLIEAAKYESRLEHLAVIKTFAAQSPRLLQGSPSRMRLRRSW